VLEKAKLLGEVLFVLTGEFRPLGIDAVAISAMTGRAAGRFCLADFRVTRSLGLPHGTADE